MSSVDDDRQFCVIFVCFHIRFDLIAVSVVQRTHSQDQLLWVRFGWSRVVDFHV